MGLRPVVCVAQDYVTGRIIDNSRLRKAILELPDNKTEHLPGYLPFVPGMPVLLTENIATELGLSNGAKGIFRQLVYDSSSEILNFNDKMFPDNTKFITQPKYALVEFPNCKFDSALATLTPKLIPITVSEQTFSFDLDELLPRATSKAAKATKRSTQITVKRRTLPLVPAYSITTHKSQGQTLSKIIVDLVMPPGRVSRQMLPGHLLPSDICSPTTLAPRIDAGVGASLSEGEGVDVDEDVGVGEGET